MAREEEERRRRDSLDEAEELASLLPDSPPRRGRRDNLSISSIASSVSSLLAPIPHKKASVTNILYFITFIVSYAGGFVELPLTRLIEDHLCHDYYDVESSTQPIDESLCKEDAIQKQLAYLLAVLSTLYSIVAFVAAFPMGIAADKVGRKPILGVVIAGILISALIELAVVYWNNVFPITAIWASAAGQLIGGGNGVLIAVVLSMIADATNEEDRAIAFMRMHVASLCGNLLSPSLAGFVMETAGPWVPPLIGIGLFLLGGLATVFLPETRPGKDATQDSLEPSIPSPNSMVSQVFGQFRDSLSILTSPSLILLLLTALCLMPVMDSTLTFLNQFVSKRYQIKIAQTGYVQSTYGVASIIVTLFILPWISGFLTNPTTPVRYRAKNEQYRDLSLARWSYAILFVGALILGISPTLAGFVFGLLLMAVGSGFGSLSKSLMSIYVDPAHRSRLFSLVNMIEVLGSVFSQPLLAGLFAVGLQLHGGWIGLPYLGLAALIALSGSLLLFVRIPRTIGAASVSRDHEDA
ncbi:major facilitator superfamily domain-containing protein [Hypoxylon argillaceum]|nr:major facilitator superfamily domain-containing protein [Hypoxylon argillaceum]KAI1153154.1 major facilitator superfamily domain-containing protein [Nemania diffusa]